MGFDAGSAESAASSGGKAATEAAPASVQQGQPPTWPLTDQERQQYNSWVIQNNVPISDDYNMEQFYKESLNPLSGISSSINPNDGQMHYPDNFKLPNHPTFSTQSNYYNPETMPDTPTWQGGPIDTPQSQALGAESYTLTRPDGTIVSSEAPWLVKDK